LKYITKAVWILSLVSLFTDTASEMLYPVMPIYLKSIGFSIVLIGLLEGVAEATSGLSKGYFGKLSDHSLRRAPFVQIGYSLSALSKPMITFFAYPLWIFFARTLDRFGKGIRTGARDAILSDEATPETRAKVFGFHRSLDTLGAVLGPALALLYLSLYPQDYKTLFIIAFVPGLLAVLTSFYLKDRVQKTSANKKPLPFFSFLVYWKESPLLYRKVVIGLLTFTFFNSSDVFLLLRTKESGLSDTMVIGIYIFYNLVYALFAFPAGIIADKVGLKKIFIIGLALFATVYFGMSANTNISVYIGLFFLYGIYGATTEGISKAWISNITDKKDTATAIGAYSGFQSICAEATFIVTGITTVAVIVYFLFVIPSPATKKAGMQR
jgi:MFS family permease